MFLLGNGSAGNLVHGAHLAALAIERRGTIYPADDDFLRLPGVTRVDPREDE